MSMHKAGSSIADNILMDIFKMKGMEIDRIALMVSSSPLSEAEIYIDYQSKMKESGVYYGIARGTYVAEMPIIDKLKVIIQVRDPRDCMTSAYFSYKTSHTLPTDPEKRKALMEYRKKLEALDINQYVLSNTGGYKKRLRILHDIAERHSDVLVLKYEDMVERTEHWLGQISDFTDQPITPELRGILGKKLDFSVDKEDVSQHKRQVTPGDHKRKLDPQTIVEVSRRLSEELALFNYT